VGFTLTVRSGAPGQALVSERPSQVKGRRGVIERGAGYAACRAAGTVGAACRGFVRGVRISSRGIEC